MSKFLVAGVALCLLAGCSASAVQGGVTPQPREKVALRAFQDVFERAVSQRDTGALVRSVAPELTLHIRGNAFTAPRERLWELMRPILTAFPDVQFHVDDVVADGDRAAARLTFTGTSGAAWHGLGPTGRRVTVTETFFCRLEGPRLRECWQEWDEAGLREQLSMPAR